MANGRRRRARRTSVGHAFGDVATFMHRDNEFAAAVEHERRDGDRREHVSNVDLAVHASERGGCAGTRRQPLEPGKPLPVTLVPYFARCKALKREYDPAPLLLPALSRGLPLGRRCSPRIPGLLHAGGERPVQDKGSCPLRIRGSEEDRHRPASESAKIAARSKPTASMTARTSSIRSSSVGTAASETRSDRPVPRLSKKTSLEKEARRRRNRASDGSSQKCSTCETKPGTNTRFKGPSPRTWYAT